MSSHNKKIGIVFGTRPCIIKMSPVLRYLEKIGVPYFVVHSGQHYSYELDKIFFDELELPLPKYLLNIRATGPQRQGAYTGRLLMDMEEIMLKEMPDILIVHGDTNTALSGALLASKITTTKEYTGSCIRLAHVEAGLRSYDRSMPEEINRVICDHLSDYLFAPTLSAKANAVREGIDPAKISVVGNTIVDAVYQNYELSKKCGNILGKMNLRPKEYVLATAHRQENVDSKVKFENILRGLAEVRNRFGLPVLYLMHPRAKNRLEQFGLVMPTEITCLEPVGFLEFLQLEANARIILTDSGGVQEESCILKVPCITLRENTERPETIEIGCNMLAGTDPNRIVFCVETMLAKDVQWTNPFGEGDSAKRIIDELLEGPK